MHRSVVREAALNLNNAQISFDLRVETRIPTSSFFRSDVFSAV